MNRKNIDSLVNSAIKNDDYLIAYTDLTDVQPAEALTRILASNERCVINITLMSNILFTKWTDNPSIVIY